METLKDKFDKGYNVRTFSKVSNTKGQEMYLEESIHFKDAKEIHNKIMLDIKEAVLKFRKYQELRRDSGLIGADDVNEFIKIFGNFEDKNE